MITAKNYAAQAEKAALDASRRNASLVATQAAQLIPISQHFAVPDGGKVLDDGLKGLDDTAIRLPYSSITVSCFCEGYRYCTIAVQSDKAIMFFFLANFNGEWEVLRWAAILDFVGHGEVGLKFVADDGSSPDDGARPLLAFLSQTVLELCEALSCSNVDSEVIEPVDQKKNEKRIKKGKLPMYETRRLVIKAPGSNSANKQRSGDTDRAGPREHLRRGHIRRLADGRKTWVQSCVVGHRDIGVIDKRYEVIT